MERARLAPLTKGRQITGPEREKIAARLRDRYDQGASIRDLTAQIGRSYGWTHPLLRESGVQLRGRGGAHPPRPTGPAVAATTPGTTGAAMADQHTESAIHSAEAPAADPVP